MMLKLIAITIVFGALLIAALPASADWPIVGDGNATCSLWNPADQNKKKEILSWMAGFMSAFNLNLASTKQPELKLEYLTYEFLINKIDNICSNPTNSNKSMSRILYGILADFPRENKND